MLLGNGNGLGEQWWARPFGTLLVVTVEPLR